MPTTFDVFFLGNFASIDPTEGNADAENASLLVGQTIGGPGTPLYNNIQTLSPGTTGFAGGSVGAYDQNNGASNDTFSINGGPDQTFDALSVYNLTLTYTDGTTATIAGIVFQDTAGGTYLAPQNTNNADQAALVAKPIESLSIDSIVVSASNGMTADRVAGSYLVPDGTVNGTAFAEDMSFSNGYQDAQGDFISNTDADSIFGGNGNDTITTGGGDDVVNGGDGNDTIFGGGDNDTLIGGNNDDTLYGGDGNDLLRPGSGTDTIFAGLGNDTLELSANDSLDGGDGTDTLDATFGNFGETVTFSADNSGNFGSSTVRNIEVFNSDGGTDIYDASAATGNLSISTGADDDTITGGAGDDTLGGGDDTDTFIVNDGFGTDTIIGGEGGTDNDVIDLSGLSGSAFGGYGSVGSETGTINNGAHSIQFSEIERIILTDQGDIIDGSASHTGQLGDVPGISVEGRGGDDFVRGGSGSDTIDGGTGADAIYGDNGNDSLSGGDGNDTMYGDDVSGTFSGDDTLDGGSGNDSILGGGGNDSIIGGLGADTISGGDGNDQITSGDGDDIVDGGAGVDTIFAGAGSDRVVLTDGHGNDIIDGGTEDTNDELDASGLTGGAGVAVTIGAFEDGTLVSAGGTVTFDQFESFILSDQADTFDANASTASFTVDAGAGDDVLTEGAGNSVLLGGTGADLFNLGTGNVSVQGGTSGVDIDTIAFSLATAQTDAVTVVYTSSGAGAFISPDGDGDTFIEIEAFQLTGFNDVLDGTDDAAGLNVQAGAGDDSILGGTGADSISGGTGADTISGGDGDDIIEGGDGDDVLSSGAGQDTLFGGDGNDTLLNSVGDDSLSGGAGDDSLIATWGNDTLDGGSGNDTLIGGADDDSVEGGAGDDVIFSGTRNIPGDYTEQTGTSQTFTGTNGNGDFTGTVTSNEGSVDQATVGTISGYNVGNGDANEVHTHSFSQAIAGVQVDFNALNTGEQLSFSIDGLGVDLNTLIANGDAVFDGAPNYEVDGSGRIILSSGGNVAQAGTVVFLRPLTDIDVIATGTGGGFIYEMRIDTNPPTYSDDDTLSGGDGADSFIIEDAFGNDTITGGEGGTDDDVIDMSGLSGPATVTSSGSEAGTITDGTDTITFSQIERLALTDQDDVVNGSADPSGLNIDARSGDDSVIGGSGGDVVFGGAGADTVDGGAGGDRILAGSGDDSVTGGTGADTIQGNAGSDTIDGGDDNDLIYGDTAPGTYVVQGFEFGKNFTADPDQLGSFAPLVVDITGDPVDIIFLDDDAVLSNDPTSEAFAANDATQTVLVNGVEHAANIEAVVFFDGDDLNTYQMAVVQVDLNDNDTADASTSEQGYYLVPIGTPPPAGVSLTYTSGDFGSDRAYADLFGSAAAGDDVLGGGAGSDTLVGGAGNDTLDGGTGNDTVQGGTGDDTIRLNDGYSGDSIAGGEDADTLDIDTLDASGVTTDGVDVLISGGESGSVTSSEGTANFVEIERFVLTGQDDTFDGNSTTSGLTVEGGAGNDSIVGGAGNNTLSGGDGDDTFSVGTGTDSISGGAGSDRIIANDPINLTFDGDGQGFFNDIPDADSGTFQQVEVIEGSAGDDTINAGGDSAGVTLFGGAGADSITGGAGDDSLGGGDGNDTIDGGAGRDTLDGGAGSDTLTGGSGPDVFIADGTADTITDFDTTTGIDGGASDDNDFVDLTGFYNLANLNAWNTANPGQTYATPLGWLRADQADGALGEAGNLVIARDNTAVAASELNAENTGVVCFVAGTLIKTVRGEVPVEDLRIGDRVQTMDNGYQPVRWIGRRTVTPGELVRQPNLRPVRINRAVFGIDGAHHDLVVSPQHRLLLVSKVAERMFGTKEVLMSAKKLLGITGAARVEQMDAVHYVHILFDHHQIVFANSVPAESLFLGPQALRSLSTEGRAEIRTLFPETARPDFTAGQCRPFAKGPRANRLTTRINKNQKSLAE